ncbi:MAG: serine/threonine protein kinase [Planctomycetales bacterium]|nr:serine/threonine protein kinase [Planctomycetales bacterium]
MTTPEDSELTLSDNSAGNPEAGIKASTSNADALCDDNTALQDPDELASAISRSKLPSRSAPPAIAGYQIVRKLGQGGMGTVYLAIDQRLNREVAIKIVSSAARERANVLQRFEAEIRALASLQHTYIAQLFSAGEYEGLPYFVMEYVHGSTLEELSREPLAPTMIARIVSQLCEAVQYCHTRGMIHRDLKPSNVLMHLGLSSSQDTGSFASRPTLQHASPEEKTAANHQHLAENYTVEADEATVASEGSPLFDQAQVTTNADAASSESWSDSRAELADYIPKIADFGLAKIVESDISQTRTGEILGTPGYMAPEQASGRNSDLTPACDIYALGAILYRLTTGRAPFVAAEPFQAVMQVISQDPIRPRALVPNLPQELEIICLKCLEKSPSKRYLTAADLREDLQRYLTGRPLVAKPAGWIEKSIKWGRRNPSWSVLGISIALGVLVAIVGLAWHANLLTDELEKTRRLAENGSELSEWLIQEHLAALAPVAGTTNVRHALVQRVQNYLDKSVRDMPPDPKYTKQLGYSFNRLAAIVGGDDPNNVGDLAAAQVNYEKALELYNSALAKGETRPGIQKLSVGALIALSTVDNELGNNEQGELRLQQAAAILKELGQDHWDSLFLHIQLVEARAERAMAANDFETALELLDQAEQYLKTSGDDAQESELTNQRIWIFTNRSKCLEFLGRLEEARDIYLPVLQLAKSEAENASTNMLTQRRYATALLRFGDILFGLYEAQSSLEYYSEAIDIIRKLYEKDPSSADLAEKLSVQYSRMSDAHLMLEDYQAAIEAIRQTVAISQDLLDRGIGGSTTKEHFAINLLSYAAVLSMADELEEAEQQLDKHQQFCLEQLESNPNSLAFLAQMAEHHFRRAMLQTSHWFKLELDPLDALNHAVFLDMKQSCSRSLEYFAKIEAISGLNYHQEQFKKQVEKLPALIEESVKEQTEDAAQ